jgi:putative Holliday junction resolvase
VRVLAVDFGLRWIGLAVSDPGGTIATPLKALRVERVREAPEAVAREAREVGADQIVVGVPLGLEGEEARPEVRRALRFAKALRGLLGVPVRTVDESLSTREGEERLQGRRAPTDPHAVAAAVILQRWLDESGGGAARP